MFLRNVTDEDLPIFFEHQRDEVSLRMAAFASRERDAFLTHWRTNVLRPEYLTRTVVVGGRVVGYIGSWEQDGMHLVAYWIGREHWGKGIATLALSEFLLVDPVRPLHAWVAAHNGTPTCTRQVTGRFFAFGHRTVSFPRKRASSGCFTGSEERSRTRQQLDPR